MGRGGGSKAARGGGGGGGGGGTATPTAPADTTTTTGGVATTPLTKDERSALDGYSGTYYREINETLRGGSPWTDLSPAELKAEIAHLDASINKGTLAAETTLYRGTSPAALGGGIPAVGTTLSDKGFLSTSRSSNIAEAFQNMSTGGVMMRITAPRGTRAADVSYHTGGHEQELLLGRSTKLKVTGVSASGGRTVVDVTVIR
jgi:hypothetical protein